MGLMDFFKNLFGGKEEAQEATPESQEAPAEATPGAQEAPSQDEQAQ